MLFQISALLPQVYEGTMDTHAIMVLTTLARYADTHCLGIAMYLTGVWLCTSGVVAGSVTPLEFDILVHLFLFCK